MKLKALTLMRETRLQAQPFVFEPIQLETQHIPPPNGDIIACPYPLFTIEMSDGNVTDDPIYGVNIVSVLCRELEPGDYAFHILFEAFGRTMVQKLDKSEPKAYASMLSLCQQYVDRLYSKDHSHSVVSRPGYAKVQTGNGPMRKYKPNDVIYIHSERLSAKRHSEIAKRINGRVSESWAVRAHWRKIEGIGLNRLGERNVNGYTWVSAHTKGEGAIRPKVYKVMA